jgi:hypothetical protein
MPKISAVALFCEDIRNELEGGKSLIGVLPLGISVPAAPGRPMDLGLFIRVLIDPSWTGDLITCHVVMLSGEEIDCGEINSTNIESMKAAAKSPDAPLVTTIHGTIIVDEIRTGWLRVLLRADGEETEIGVLHIVVAP